MQSVPLRQLKPKAHISNEWYNLRHNPCGEGPRCYSDSRMLGLIRKTFTLLHETTVSRLFTAMVRPHFEYGNVIWHPRYRGDKLEVEKVQRRTTKLIPSISHLPYEDRLKFLKLPSLDFRRRREDMIHVFRITNGMDRLEFRQ